MSPVYSVTDVSGSYHRISSPFLRERVRVCFVYGGKPLTSILSLWVSV
jgi:hypothetical protein